jgi:predicted RNA-binding Zn-ribbon protein involved in translation (DUF1610 family)
MNDDDALWLDGNALAGLLGEVFAMEMTAVQRACAKCGVRAPVGAHRMYRGAGAVLRCPACGDLALRMAILEDRHVVQLRGTWTLEVRS